MDGKKKQWIVWCSEPLSDCRSNAVTQVYYNSLLKETLKKKWIDELEYMHIWDKRLKGLKKVHGPSKHS